MNLEKPLILQGTQAGRCAACKAVFDPNLEQGGNTNIVAAWCAGTPLPEIPPPFSSTAGAVLDVFPRSTSCALADV